MQQGCSQNFRVEIVSLSELHLDDKGDDVTITDANGFPITGPIHKDIDGVHHILKGGLRPKSDSEGIVHRLPILMRLYSSETNTQ